MGEDEGLESLEQLRSLGASPPTPTMGTGLGWCLVGYQVWGHSLHLLGPLSAPPRGCSPCISSCLPTGSSGPTRTARATRAPGGPGKSASPLGDQSRR